MLDLSGPTGKSGAVAAPDDDVIERGRAIFDRLRRAGPEPVLDPEHEAEPGVRAEADGPAPALADDSVSLQVEPDVKIDEGSAPPRDIETTDQDVAAEVRTAFDVPGRAGEGAQPPGDGHETAPVDEAAPSGGEPAVVVGSEARAPGPVPLGVPPDAVVSLLEPGDHRNTDPADFSPTRFARPLPRVMAIANQKGGVGKTTTAVNLGAGLAELGYRVLVVDLDPQGNATTGLGINPRNLEASIYDVMMHDVPLDDCIEPTTLRNLFVCPATIDLAGAEIELVPAFSRELKLRRAVEQILDDFDFVVIDCPPSLGLITINALAAASEVVVPIQCEYYALEGLGQLLRNVNLVQTNLNPRLEVSAIVLTMFDARTKLADQVATEVRNHFGPKVCRNIVPRTVRLSEAPSFGQPIVVFDPTSRGAIAYRELAKEVSGGAPQRVG